MLSKTQEKEKGRFNLFIRKEIALYKKNGGLIKKQEDEKVVLNLLVRNHLNILPTRDGFEIEGVYDFEPVHLY